MKRAFIVFVGFFTVASWTIETQGQPNFSGVWKQNMAKSSKTSLQSYTQKIEHAGNVLKITTITGGPRGESSFDKPYEIGKETKSSDKEGDQFTSVVTWEGQTLVFLTSEQEESGTIDTRETWTLSDDGRTLTKVIHSHSPRGDREQAYVLDKPPA